MWMLYLIAPCFLLNVSFKRRKVILRTGLLALEGVLTLFPIHPDGTRHLATAQYVPRLPTLGLCLHDNKIKTEVA